MSGKKTVIEAFHHVLLGCLLTLKGIDKIAHHPFIGGVILCFGLILIGYFIYIIRRKSVNKTLSLMAHTFEGMAILLITYVLLQEGKTYLPYVTFAAAIGCFVAVVVIYRKAERH